MCLVRDLNGEEGVEWGGGGGGGGEEEWGGGGGRKREWDVEYLLGVISSD